MTQLRIKNAERIREVRLQLQSLVEDLYWGDIEGAQKVCKVIDIPTLRFQYLKGTRYPVVGFSFHALDTYLPKLVRAGLRVAICDEIKSGKK